MSKPRPHIPERVKVDAILRRAMVLCPLCKFAINPGDKTMWEHMVPRELGGKDDAENLALVHHPCGKKKRTAFTATYTRSERPNVSKHIALAPESNENTNGRRAGSCNPAAPSGESE